MDLDIKICGLKTEEAVAAAVQGGASHIGFIFVEKSPRNVSPQAAGRLRRIARGLSPRVRAVAVTVDAGDDALDAIVATAEPDMLQLHGRETPERAQQVRTRYGLPVMKSIAVRTADDLARLAAYEGVADRFLLDAKAPAEAALPGGNGIAFDWSLLGALDRRFDFMLSGGLDAENVGRALAVARPDGIDVSSGVESAPGVKDVALVRRFLDAAREAAEKSPA